MDNEKIELILKEYDYLSELNTEGFLWEFIRRNEEYKKTYKEYEKRKKYYHELIFDPPLQKDEKEISWFVRTHGRKFPRFKTLFYPFGLEYPLNPALQANDRTFIRPCKNLPGKKSKEKNILIEYFRLIIKPIFHYHHEFQGVKNKWNNDWIKLHQNYISVLIDMNAPINKIVEAAEELVSREKSYLKDESERIQQEDNISIDRHSFKRKREWTNYLIAYDLSIISGYRIEKIADILFSKTHRTHHGSSICTDCKNAGRYVEKATELINTKYKDYLSYF